MKKKKSPLNQVLEQIADLLQIVEEKQTAEIKGELPSDIEKSLDALEAQVAFFKEITNKMFEEAKISPKEIQESLEDPARLSTEQQALLEKSNKLANSLKEKERAYKQQKEMILEREKREGKGKEPSKAKKKQARSKKFKRLGGKDDWKPV